MKKQIKVRIAFVLSLSVVIAISSIYSCNSVPPAAQNNEVPSQQSLVERGNYIVNTLGGCNDCHSPKIFLTDGTMVPDTSRLLSGHPAGEAIPKVDTSAVIHNRWVLTSSDLTAFVGSWGISYTANLTPDTLTGIGGWTEENFIQAMRTGRHMGIPTERHISPPMTWYYLARATDYDLKAIFAYLKSLKPISNPVPPPVSPAEFVK